MHIEMKKHVKTAGYWSALAVFALAIASTIPSFFGTIQYRGSNYIVYLGSGALWFNQITGPPEDVNYIISLEPPGWSVNRALTPFRNFSQVQWPQYRVSDGRKAKGFHFLGFNVMGAFGRITTKKIIVPLWIPATPGLLLLLLKWRRKKRVRKVGMCIQCGYNLAGNVSGRCPECGASVTRQLFHISVMSNEL